MGTHQNLTILQHGQHRLLTPDEKNQYNTKYKYVITEEYGFARGGCIITVPPGFLTDGSSGGPDYGMSWIFHDWLYSTHCFDGDTECTRRQADHIMNMVLKQEGRGWYRFMFSTISWWNPIWSFSRAWNKSGVRGPEYLIDLST
jgi:hypothetical protein